MNSIKGDQNMLPNGRIREVVTDGDLSIYADIVDTLQKIRLQPSRVVDEQGNRLAYNCHSICRALQAVYPQLTLVDGYHFTVRIVVEGGFRPEISATTIHSWLQAPDGAIIDPRPVSVLSLNPIMFPKTGSAAETYASTYLEFPDVIKKVDMERVVMLAKSWELVIREIQDCPF